MNAKNVLQELHNKYPGKKVICLPKNNPTEIICEIEPTEDHPGHSNTIAIIDRSEPHYHKKLRETYQAMQGELIVYVDGKKHQLTEGDSLVIEPGAIHYAYGQETWIECTSEPGWNPDDHILVKTKRTALIAPINPKGELLIQDRKGHFPPPWGFFGGSIELGETPEQAVVRETEEELGIQLSPDDIQYIGFFEYMDKEEDRLHLSHVYVWKTKLQISEFNLMEGADLKFVSFNEAKRLFSFGGDFEILENVKQHVEYKNAK